MNLEAFDLNLLLAFEALIEERHVTRAARRIGLSQPAMSNALARLRRTLDDPVLVRTATGMRPTPKAEALAEPVRSALAQLRSALGGPGQFVPHESRKTMRLLTTDYGELLVLGPVLARLGREAPGIHIRSRRSRRMFRPPAEQELAEEYDLALGFCPDAVSLDASLRSECLWRDRVVCIARRNHPAIRGRLSLAEYGEAGHVSTFYKSGGPGVLDAMLEQQGLKRRLVASVPHFTTLPFLVASSDLIATVPERLASRFRSQLRLQVLPAPLPIAPLAFTMLWHKRRDRDPEHAWLRSQVLEAAGTTTAHSHGPTRFRR
jgi:DNA-binding transcriptional LysR family regulator